LWFFQVPTCDPHVILYIYLHPKLNYPQSLTFQAHPDTHAAQMAHKSLCTVQSHTSLQTAFAFTANVAPGMNQRGFFGESSLSCSEKYVRQDMLKVLFWSSSSVKMLAIVWQVKVLGKLYLYTRAVTSVFGAITKAATAFEQPHVGKLQLEPSVTQNASAVRTSGASPPREDPNLNQTKAVNTTHTCINLPFPYCAVRNLGASTTGVSIQGLGIVMVNASTWRTSPLGV
jgi:hypothetical protein